MPRNKGGRVQSMNGAAYNKAVRRSGMVFEPEIHYPSLGLALTQHLVRAGGLNGADEFEDRMSKQFPDSLQWGQFVSFLGMFKFSQPPAKTLDAFLGLLTTLVLVWRALGGVEFAWRLWAGLFEDIIGDADITWASNEPVANLTVREGDHYGWDSHFPHYHLMVWRTLEASVDNAKAERTLIYSASTPQGHHFRAVADGLLKLVYDQGDKYVSGSISDQVSGSIMEHVARSNPHLLQPHPTDHLQTAYAASIFGDSSVIAPTSADSWAKRMKGLMRSELGSGAAWPVEGGTVRDLSRLLDVHRFGAIRDMKNGTKGRPHEGLDIVAPQGSRLVAMYGGKVVELRNDYKEQDAVDKAEGWAKGNYIIIESPTGVEGSTLRHGYYHMRDVSPGLSVGSDVVQGSALGSVGSTGNSTGPHLHLTTTWVDDHNHIIRALDPERVIVDGAITAARQGGASLGDTGERPILAPVMWTLASIASPGHIMPPNVAGLPFAPPAPQVPAAGGLLDIGRRATNTMISAMESGPGNTALKAAWLAVGVPPVAVDSMISAMRAGYETSVTSGADPGAVMRAALAALTPAASAAAADPRVQQVAQEQLAAALASGQLGSILGSSMPMGGNPLAGLDQLLLPGDDDDDDDDV